MFLVNWFRNYRKNYIIEHLDYEYIDACSNTYEVLDF